jgi:hypothetical protein
MSKADDQREQLLQSDYTDKSGRTAGETQPIVYPKLDGEGPTSPKALNRDSANSQKDRRKWGTKVMGAPAAPSAHPQNKEAATWTAPAEHPTPSSYIVQPSPVQHSKCPLNSAQHCFNKWTKKAENLASEVWTNLKTGNNMSDAAWGKLTLGAKALTEGGFEALFRQTFSVSPEEKLQKTYACYLSTSTGPVAGTLYISTVKIAFCSDRPLSFTAPSGETSWSYYRLAIPLTNLKAVNPSTNKDNPAEKYIQIMTVDGHDFWMMGFINYNKATSKLQESTPNSARSVPRREHRSDSSTLDPTEVHVY